MSVAVQEWPSLEVQTCECLPENYNGLLDWVLDESTVAGEENREGEIPYAASGSKISNHRVERAIDDSKSIVSQKVPPSPSARQDQQDDSDGASNKGSKHFTEVHDSPGPDKSREGAPISNSPCSVNPKREKVSELGTKQEIQEGGNQELEQTPPMVNDSLSSWDVSAVEEHPITPDNHEPADKQDEEEGSHIAELPSKTEEPQSSRKPHSSSVAAWVMDTGEAPVAVIPAQKAKKPLSHCCDIDPETGELLPAIEHPETRINHELDLRSEPGWRRSNMTSEMQISRELRARAKLAEHLRERLVPHTEAVRVQSSQEESTFPRADCVIRPVMEDDIAVLAEIVNSEQPVSKVPHSSPRSTIKTWDMMKIFKMCKENQRPFIVATGGEDELLDRSKWPAVTDRAYREYLKYRSNFVQQKSAIVGFAFAAPRQGSSIDSQDVRTNHYCYVTLFVHPDHRNRKYGSALLDRILMSVSPVHRSLIDFEWKCDNTAEVYEELASRNNQQYSRVFVEYLDAHDEAERLLSRTQVLKKFGFRNVGHLTCLKFEIREGRRCWLDLFVWELEAQPLEDVR